MTATPESVTRGEAFRVWVKVALQSRRGVEWDRRGKGSVEEGVRRVLMGVGWYRRTSPQSSTPQLHQQVQYLDVQPHEGYQ